MEKTKKNLKIRKMSKEIRINPLEIEIVEGYNVRKVDTQSEDYLTLKQQIKSNGLQIPLMVRKCGEVHQLVRGEHRLTAIRELIAEGEDFPTVKCEVTRMTREQMDIDLAQSNTTVKLSLYSQALIVERLLNRGYKTKEITAKVGFSATIISNAKILLNADKETRQKMFENEISPILVLETLRAAKDADGNIDEKAVKETVNTAIETAKAAGKKTATAKHAPKQKTDAAKRVDAMLEAAKGAGKEANTPAKKEKSQLVMSMRDYEKVKALCEQEIDEKFGDKILHYVEFNFTFEEAKALAAK